VQPDFLGVAFIIRDYDFQFGIVACNSNKFQKAILDDKCPGVGFFANDIDRERGNVGIIANAIVIFLIVPIHTGARDMREPDL
jgi:hypothetical protein